MGVRPLEKFQFNTEPKWNHQENLFETISDQCKRWKQEKLLISEIKTSTCNRWIWGIFWFLWTVSIVYQGNSSVFCSCTIYWLNIQYWPGSYEYTGGKVEPKHIFGKTTGQEYYSRQVTCLETDPLGLDHQHPIWATEHCHTWEQS